MDEPTSSPELFTLPADAPAPNPVREASLDLLESKLPHEQAKVLKAERKAKAAAAKAEPAPAPALAPVAKAAEPAPEPAPAPETTEEVVDFTAPEEKPKADEPTPEDLTTDELAKLDEKAKKKISDRDKENVKLRHRAQEVEAKIKDAEAKLAEREAEAKTLAETLQALQLRGPALAGNQFGHIADAQVVNVWGTNAQEALVLLANHEKAVKNGRADESDPVMHELPNGEEIDLNTIGKAAFERRVHDAQVWFATDHKVGLNKDSANKVLEKHAALDGYKKAHEGYLRDPEIHTRYAELAAKAAFYDTLMARGAKVTFSDKATAASKAVTEKEAPAPAKASKAKTAPPNESTARTPRLAPSMEGEDISARRSLLMEQARKASSYDEQQKLLKQLMMLPNPARRMASFVA